tara:strand:+ start:2363 stop:3289 length:927 start_codon:yes stop_codon:yes gene_type:complete
MLNYNLKLFSHNKLFNDFVNLDLKNKLPSRILLTGNEGIGKCTFALHFINYLFSKNETIKYNLSDNTINAISKSYNLINNLTHPNLSFISKVDEKRNIDIAQIRQMISFLNQSSLNNYKKIILIDGVEDLNLNSANALLKSLEESNFNNLFILIHNINRPILDTVRSRCITYKLNFNFHDVKSILSDHFNDNLYDKLNLDFKAATLSPKFIINHINFINENKLDLKTCDIESVIKYIIEKKAYKKNYFIINSFQSYIEIYFTKMYLRTKDYKYYDNFISTITETNLINKFNLDLDSFFIKFENKYLNI